MQIFLPAATILSTAASPVTAIYDDTTVISLSAHPGCVVFWFPDLSYIVRSGIILTLDPSWRNALNSVINQEAQRRILISFPEYVQRNATQDTQDNMRTYGLDSTQWPQSAQDQQTEINRGWSFVDSYRASSNNLQPSAPVNPCDDSLWPAQIPPIQLTV